MTTPINDLDKQAKAFADAREALGSIVTDLNAGIEALKRQHMPALKKAVAKAAEKHDGLKAIIEANPALFVKPRTMTLHGIKFGYAKGKGVIKFDDAAQVCKLVRKHLPDQVETLLSVREKPIKDALAVLPAQDLKRLGCTVIETGDAVVIRPADSEVDKLVQALIVGATDEQGV